MTLAEFIKWVKDAFAALMLRLRLRKRIETAKDLVARVFDRR